MQKLLNFIDNNIMSGQPVEKKKGFFSCCSGEEEKGNVYVDLNNKRETQTNAYVPPPRKTSLNQPLPQPIPSTVPLPSPSSGSPTTPLQRKIDYIRLPLTTHLVIDSSIIHNKQLLL